MKPEAHVGGIVVLITMPGTDRVIGRLDRDLFFDELSANCEHAEMEGPLVNGVYAVTVDCTWKNPGARIALVRKLAEKHYHEDNPIGRT